MDDAQFSILSTLESDLLSRASSPTPETFSQASTPTTQKRKRKLTALSTWDHSRKPEDHEPERAHDGQKLWYCCHCVGKLYATQSTTSARYHLKHTHKIEVVVDDS